MDESALPTTQCLKEEAHRLHAEAVVIDMCSFQFQGFSSEIGASGVTVLNLTVPETSAHFEEAVAAVEAHHRMIDRDPERLLLVRRVADIWEAKASGRVGLILGFQNARPIEADLGRIRTFWRLGVRVVQLTYNERNLLGDGCLEPADGGLTRLGRRAISELNDAGIVVDLSHAGHRTTLEAVEFSRQPVIISHANPRAVIDNPRNVTDDQIRAVAAAHGVIGVCGWSPILWRGTPSPPGVHDLVHCIDYIVDLAGVDCVGLGLDSPAAGIATVTAHAAEINRTYPKIVGAFVAKFGDGLAHRYAVPVQSLPRVTEALLQRGYRASDVLKILGGNFMRVFDEVWNSAETRTNRGCRNATR